MKRKVASSSVVEEPIPAKEISGVYQRIREILESARAGVARTVNTTQVVANWLIGREIVNADQQGKARAEYGRNLLIDLSARMRRDYGRGYSVDNLEAFRLFFLAYPHLISETALRKSPREGKSETLSRISTNSQPDVAEWQPGLLHSSISWSHYRLLLKIETTAARAFYEIEAIENSWSVRELERQINSLLFERLAKSRDKVGLMKLATKGQELAAPADVFKDPVVIEFLGLPESHRLVESDLEQALINNLQAFLLELGKGFAFVSRQERITLDGDHFYIDLVFYHTVLKCHILIDLKVGKLTHGDLGQMQLYPVRYAIPLRLRPSQPLRPKLLRGLHKRPKTPFHSTPRRPSPGHQGTSTRRACLLRSLSQPNGCHQARKVSQNCMGKTIHQSARIGLSHGVNANFFDQERRTEGDNPTLGLILCTDKNDAVVKYRLGPDQSKKIFTSRYKLHLPTEAELATELKREIRSLR